MASLDTITITTKNDDVLGPYQNILKSDTFNDWRRKTNGLNELIKSVAEGISDQTITIQTDRGLQGGDSFTLNDNDDKVINIALDETFVATRSFVSESVGAGYVTFIGGSGISLSGNTTFSLNEADNQSITIEANADFDITDVIQYNDELYQTGYFDGDGTTTTWDLSNGTDFPGFQDPTSPYDHGPVTQRANGYIVTIDGVYQQPGDNDASSTVGSYYISGDNLIFFVAPPNGSKCCISSVIGYNPSSGINDSTITVTARNGLQGGGTFTLNQINNESLKLSIIYDSGTFAINNGNKQLEFAQISEKKVLGNLGVAADKPAPVDVDTSINDSSSDSHLVTAKAVKDYADSVGIGVNQTWSLLTETASDVPFAASWDNYTGETFTNDSDKPISVHVWATASSKDHTRIYIQFDPDNAGHELVIATNTNSGGGQETAGSIIVPARTSYRFRNYDPGAPVGQVNFIRISILS
jgi:hypothetical protein